MPGGWGRVGRAVLVALVAAVTAVAPAPVADAVDGEPACFQPPPQVDPIAEVPWAQALFDPAGSVWPFSTGSNVRVAVLDSGVDGSYPQLAGAVLPGFDFVRGVPEGDVDCVPHGTAVASLIAGRAAAGVGFVGLAPRSQILPVRITDRAAGGPSGTPLLPAAVAAGIDYAVAQGAAVINVSAVLYVDDPAVAAAVTRAISAGVVIVAAVGNGHAADRDGDGPTTEELTPYPAAYDGVIGVGAVDATGRRAPDSQVGAYVDLVAPGVDIIAGATGGHGVYAGTSFATAFVSATVALLLAQRPLRINAGQSAARVVSVTDRLVATASPSAGGRLEYGAGLLDPYQALTEPVTVQAPSDAGARTPPPPDAAALALAAERAADDRRALLITGGVGTLAVLLVAAALVLPRARRRRWRAGSAPAGPAGADRQPEFLPGEALFGPGRDAAPRR